MRRFCWPLVLCAVVAIAACGSSNPIASSDVGQCTDAHLDTITVGGEKLILPGLPVDGVPLRNTQDVTQYTFTDGDQLAGQGDSMTGTALHLSSSGLSWSVLGVSVGDGQRPEGLHLAGTSDGVYIGVSNYADSRWTWMTAPHTEPYNFELPFSGLTSSSGDFYVAAVCMDGAAADIELTVDITSDTWNIMVWMAADNDLAPDAVADLNEMEAIGSTENINILVGYDIDPESAGGGISGIDEVCFIKVVGDTNDNAIITDGDPANHSFPRADYDSSDPANLVAFQDWVAANFKTSRSVLILWDHGDGWRQEGASGKSGSKSACDLSNARRISGVLSDDSDGSGNMSTNPAIAGALAGRHFDILAFDACNMGHIEAVYEYRSVADYLVASETLVPSSGYPYDLILGDLDTYPHILARMFGTLIADRYTNFWDSQGDEGSLALFESAQLGPLAQALANLAADVTPKATAESDHVKGAIWSAFEPQWGDGVRDLKDFIGEYRLATSDTTIQGLLDDAQATFDSAVLNSSNTINLETNGLAVFLPNTVYLDMHKDEYRPISFNQATHWLEMLEATGVPDEGGEYPVNLNWEPGDKIIATWSGDPNVDLKAIIIDSSWNEGWPGNPGELDGIIEFSQDSSDSGTAEEWGRLEATAPGGVYTFILNYSSFESLPATFHVQLLDSSDVLKEDLGNVVFEYAGEQDVAILFYDDGTGVSWEPGDWLEISWADADADFDMWMMDPQGYWGAPGAGEMLYGIVEFSEDSATSGETREWAKLLPGGGNGPYQVDIEYFDYAGGSPPATIEVTLKLYDSAGQLKEDLGTIQFLGDGYLGNDYIKENVVTLVR